MPVNKTCEKRRSVSRNWGVDDVVVVVVVNVHSSLCRKQNYYSDSSLHPSAYV